MFKSQMSICHDVVVNVHAQIFVFCLHTLNSNAATKLWQYLLS